MSKQIERLMKKYPQIFYDVSYEGNFEFKDGEWGDGTWLFMNAGWYCLHSECGTIHEYSIKEVLYCASRIYQDKEGWAEENPDDTETLKKMWAGDYDK
tara:strand:+ start:524 stop:817 length:294 start_codon:yes stop_codon:yes gene_type:complete